MPDFYDHIEMLRPRRELVALATVVDVVGGSSTRLGARMWVTRGGERLGSLTVGGCADGRAAEEAALVLDDGVARLVPIALGDDDADFGMSCAGTVHVFIERVDMRDSPVLRAFDKIRISTSNDHVALYVMPLDGRSARWVAVDSAADAPWGIDDVGRALMLKRMGGCTMIPSKDDRPALFLQSFVPAARLVVVGTGPVADPLVHLAADLGYRVIVVDGRPIDEGRFPAADERIEGIPSEVCGELPLDERSVVVIAAHDYKYEVPVLREVVNRGLGYVGFVAGRQRGAAVLNFLESSGIDPALLQQVCVPVGLDIGALTPEEIAVSVMAEVLAVRSGTGGGPLRTTPHVKAEEVSG